MNGWLKTPSPLAGEGWGEGGIGLKSFFTPTQHPPSRGRGLFFPSLGRSKGEEKKEFKDKSKSVAVRLI
jgi:hypothetical protein